MNNTDKIKQVFDSQNHAEDYDEKARRSNWAAPEILFGLSYDCIKPGEKLLDMGIGTGLSSTLYHKAGLVVYGMDYSVGMLKICAEKGIAKDLKRHDLLVAPYPYADNSMDHVVSTGVFHIFDDLSLIFSEVSRILKSNGFFIFCVMDSAEKEERKINLHDQMISGKSVSIYRYSEADIQDLLKLHRFQLIKTVSFMGIHDNKETPFRVYLSTLNNFKD